MEALHEHLNSNDYGGAYTLMLCQLFVDFSFFLEEITALAVRG